jgi:hypothetical protein
MCSTELEKTMMMRTILFKKTGYAVLVTACLMLGPGISQAQTVVPGQTPQIRTGTIDWVDPATGTVVIDDRQYVLPGAFRGSTTIRPGMEIRFRYTRQGNEKVITEIMK